jgi:hypothetical protein
MRRMLHPVVPAVCGLFLLAAAPAQATLTFTLDLINDVQATLTGVGLIEGVDLPAFGVRDLNLEGAATGAGGGTEESFDGDFVMQRGDLTRDVLAASVDSSGDFNMLFDGRLGLSYGPSGSAIITLSGGETWQSAGSTGVITLEGVAVGMWSIVPEPSPALLMGLGLAGLAFIGRKPRRV